MASDLSFMDRAAILYAKYREVHEKCADAVREKSPGWSPLIRAAEESMGQADTALRNAWSMLDNIERATEEAHEAHVAAEACKAVKP